MVIVGNTTLLPEVAVEDVQSAGETAWQEAALVLDHVSVAELPTVTEVGDTDKATVGGIFTVTGELLIFPQPLWQTKV